MGRFINADIFTSTGQGTLSSNMYAYCLNNPVNLIDSTGQISLKALKVIISGLIGAVTNAFLAATAGDDLEKIFWAAVDGFLYGCIAELLDELYVVFAIIEGLRVAFDGIKSGANIAHSIGTGILTAVFSIGMHHLNKTPNVSDVSGTLLSGFCSMSFQSIVGITSTISADNQGGNDYTKDRERQKQLQYEIYYYKGDYVGSWTRFPLLY